VSAVRTVVVVASQQLLAELLAESPPGTVVVVHAESIEELVGALAPVDLGDLDLDPARHAELTRREQEVASLVALRLSNKEIAARLHVSVSTVKTHVHTLLRKLDASTRTEAARRLRADGNRPF
jgi:DNA-binding CsgD family transcriptional regulator